MIATSKAEMRKTFRATRDSIPAQIQISKSLTIIKKIQNFPVYINAKSVGIFYPLENEVDLRGLLSDQTKRFCLPKIIDFHKLIMEFGWYEGRFEAGRFGLSEPVGPIAPKNEIELLLVPGLVFSRNGYRIGYGKGFFDYYLKDFTGYTIGVGFHEQLIEEFQAEDHDIRLHSILTDKEEICIQR